MATIGKSTNKKSRKTTLNGLFYLKIRSRHPSHNVLRKNKALQFPRRILFRLGSTSESPAGYVEINKINAVKTSANKLLMKRAFTKNEIKTADWWTSPDGKNFLFQESKDNSINIKDLPFPIVAKHNFGSRNNGNTLVRSLEELNEWLRGKTLSNYIFEKYYNFSREYRIHATPSETFYTCRKVLRNDVPEDQRWFRNDQNSNWILEENPLFDKPVNWPEVCKEACKAIAAVELDIGAVDIRIQSAKSEGKARKKIEFIILETNSAPSFGERTTEKYITQIKKDYTQNEF